MTTLADVNATLGVTNIALAGVSKNTEKTNEGITGFLDYLKGKDAVDRRREIETTRETKPILKSLTGGAAAIGGGLVSAGKSTFGFGKGVLGKLAIPAGFVGGFLTSLLSSKLLKGGILGLGLMFGDEIAEMLTGRDAKQAVKDQVAGAIKGGSIGFLFGPRFGAIGALLGALVKNPEIDKQAGELVTNLKNMGIDMPKLSDIFKKINTGVADGLKGINAILKGNFDVNSTVDALKLLGGAAFLVSPAGSLFLLKGIAKSRVGRALIAIAGLGYATGLFDDKKIANESGGEFNNDVKPQGGDVGGLSSFFSLENIIGAGTAAYLTKQLVDLGKGAFGLLKKFGLFGKATAGAELATDALSKSLANQNKPYRLFRNFQRGILSGLGKFGMFMTKVGPLAIPLAAVGITEAIFGDDFRAEAEKNKQTQNAIKATTKTTAAAKDFFKGTVGFMEDFSYNKYGTGQLSLNKSPTQKIMTLQESNRLLANLNKGEGLSSNLIDAGTVKVNSDNINTYQNSAIAIGGSGAFDIRDNLGKQIQGFGT